MTDMDHARRMYRDMILMHIGEITEKFRHALESIADINFVLQSNIEKDVLDEDYMQLLRDDLDGLMMTLRDTMDNHKAYLLKKVERMRE